MNNTFTELVFVSMKIYPKMLTVCILMEFPVQIDAISMGFLILVVNGRHF